jgi:hypothetical protein
VKNIHDTIIKLADEHGGGIELALRAQAYYERRKAEYLQDPATHAASASLVIDELFAEVAYWRERTSPT